MCHVSKASNMSPVRGHVGRAKGSAFGYIIAVNWEAFAKKVVGTLKSLELGLSNKNVPAHT